MKSIKVRITFTEEVLGSAPSDPEIYRRYIASKAPDASSIEEEVAAIGVDVANELSMTVFPRDENGNIIIWDYQLKGFFKEACGVLRSVTEYNKDGTKKKYPNESSKLTNYKKKIDGLVFPFPRKNVVSDTDPMGVCQRPLRGQTAQGERIALANSETIPAGSTFVTEIKYLSEDLHDAIIEWLDYGMLKGLGQWRNSGKGRFVYEIIE